MFLHYINFNRKLKMEVEVYSLLGLSLCLFVRLNALGIRVNSTLMRTHNNGCIVLESLKVQRQFSREEDNILNVVDCINSCLWYSVSIVVATLLYNERIFRLRWFLFDEDFNTMPTPPAGETAIGFLDWEETTLIKQSRGIYFRCKIKRSCCNSQESVCYILEL